MKEKTKKRQRPTILSRDPYKRRSESEMTKIVQEINSGIITKRAACRKYGLNRRTLARFIQMYSVRTLEDDLSTQLLSRMSEEQHSKVFIKKIKELTKALQLARLKTDGLETMIKVAEEQLHIKIRKKPGTKQSRK